MQAGISLNFAAPNAALGTFDPLDTAVIDTVTEMSMLSWPAYENYTGRLGVQTITSILGNHHSVRVEPLAVAVEFL